MTRDKLLDKLRKIKAHADSAAAIGSESEAQAFAEVLQKLLLDNKMEMTDIEFEEMEKEQPIIKKMVDFDDDDVRKSRVAWMERLAGVIARAHFCRILVYPGSSKITLVGREENIAVAEYMIVTLQKAADSIAKKAHSAYCWEVYKQDGSCYRARGFKSAFLQAFVMHLAERYEAEKRSRMAGPSTSTALVRINREEAAVEDFMNKNYKKKAGALSTHTAFHREGHRRGVAAADRINLRSDGLTSGNDQRLIR